MIKESDLNNYDFKPDNSFLNKNNIFILDIIWLDLANTAIKKIKDKEESIICSPKYNEKNRLTKTESPQVNLHLIKNTYTRIDSSNFYNYEKILIERINYLNIDHCNYKAGNLVLHGRRKGLVRKPASPITVNESCLFLGGNGSFNYYHWLIEIAPKLLLINNQTLKNLNIEKIAVNNKVKEIKQFNEILEIVVKSKGIKCEIATYSNKENLYFKSLYYINNLNNILYNSKKIISSPTHCYISKENIINLRDIMLAHKKKPNKLQNKIFLLRNKKHVSDYNKRDYNEKEILEYFLEQGFSGIYVEDYSFKEQVYIFNNADFIAGPSGAFWANIIFCKENTKAISWLNSNTEDFSLYSTLSKIVNCNMRFCRSYEKDSEVIHGEYYLEPNDVKELYIKMMSSA